MDTDHPVMVAALAAAQPIPTPPGEAQRVAADIEHMQHREAIRGEQAMRLQDRYLQRVPGML